MALALVFIAIGLVWLPFRNQIARRQYAISSQMLGRRTDDVLEDSEPQPEAEQEVYEERVRGFEMLGVFFCSVLIVGGLLIVVLTLIFRPPWAGA
ncbi:hypothetical protein ACIQC5_18810 [Paenarthrobacter sp. NPDC092416]|uniref:hypothetical protein n=1 Tax=Paenarthrobacter sp. NPDC092416 TaxID=3364386 RepID=UPI0037FD1978